MKTNNINDCHTASRVWLKEKLEREEYYLYDYDRPLKEMRQTKPFSLISLIRQLLP